MPCDVAANQVSPATASAVTRPLGCAWVGVGAMGGFTAAGAGCAVLDFFLRPRVFTGGAGGGGTGWLSIISARTQELPSHRNTPLLLPASRVPSLLCARTNTS